MYCILLYPPISDIDSKRKTLFLGRLPVAFRIGSLKRWIWMMKRLVAFPSRPAWSFVSTEKPETDCPHWPKFWNMVFRPKSPWVFPTKLRELNQLASWQMDFLKWISCSPFFSPSQDHWRRRCPQVSSASRSFETETGGNWPGNLGFSGGWWYRTWSVVFNLNRIHMCFCLG